MKSTIEPRQGTFHVGLSHGLRPLCGAWRCQPPEGPAGCRQIYWMPCLRRGDPGVFCQPASGKWGVSPAIIRVPLATKVATDGSLAVGMIWRNASSVAYNWNESHQCLHSTPYCGFLNAGEEKSMEGRIYILEGGMDALAARVRGDFPTLFYEDVPPPDPNWVMTD